MDKQATPTTDKLANITRLATSGPQLSRDERAEYERICKRVHRAEADLRRASSRQDRQKTLSANRSLVNARARRAEFLAPKISQLWAPTRIVYKNEARWSGPSGTGVHRHEVEMVLDYKDLGGPEYRIVRVISDEGAPSTNARGAPNCMGVAWFALEGHIKAGKIIVLDADPAADGECTGGAMIAHEIRIDIDPGSVRSYRWLCSCHKTGVWHQTGDDEKDSRSARNDGAWHVAAQERGR